ncbi:MAG: YifB family Mg chelatase-like AAA ATPase [Defluviitaleaceae bacterium]|nr:YifB family Mg chelatase-like AAA ATPase [Defluviitaleaceae bacterium]MCL2836984.1 YifB family Mg chelatase-like AAA ATPase [Defluviitaleaceae bacterium]
MVNKIISGAVEGVEGTAVVVEVDISPGLPGTEVVGLPDSAVKESRERVRAAIRNSGLRMPSHRVTVNLAPASTKKAGASFDLPIAVGILCGTEEIAAERAKNVFITGELSLDGTIRPVGGILSMVINAYKNGVKRFIVPFENGGEASLVDGARVAAIKTLADLVRFFKTGILPDYAATGLTAGDTELMETEYDFSDVKGQAHVKRALEVAAAGAHNVLMTGPPGSGKTMLAKRVPSILGDMTFDESIEVTKIYSVAGFMKTSNQRSGHGACAVSNQRSGHGAALITARPFRSPHHTTSYSALVGGGKLIQPGEISLAHNGVLFLDEFPEFYKDVREALRQPMEDGEVTVSRASGKVTFPSAFMLICAMNPCPCGYFGEGAKCTCSQREVNGYQERLSGPLLDRIDIHITVPRVDYDKLQSAQKTESSADIRKRVMEAQSLQRERYRDFNAKVNARLTEPMLERFCALDSAGAAMLETAYEKMGLSARAYHKIIKVARTIADLDGGGAITERHLGEALQYRGIDRGTKYY